MKLFAANGFVICPNRNFVAQKIEADEGLCDATLAVNLQYGVPAARTTPNRRYSSTSKHVRFFEEKDNAMPNLFSMRADIGQSL